MMSRSLISEVSKSVLTVRNRVILNNGGFQDLHIVLLMSPRAYHELNEELQNSLQYKNLDSVKVDRFLNAAIKVDRSLQTDFCVRVQ